MRDRTDIARALGAALRATSVNRLVVPALVLLVGLLALAVVPQFFAPFDPSAQSLGARFLPPLTGFADSSVPTHWLGTDSLGRDVLSRIVYGTRISILVGVIGALCSGVLGVSLGIVAGYYQRTVDAVISRLIDIQMAFPFLLFALLILFFFGGGLLNVILALMVVRWTVYARSARSIVLGLKNAEFVDAARMAGASGPRIMYKHLLRNLMAPMVVLATLETARLILAEATLSFLGVGIQPPEVSWGLMIAGGRVSLGSAPWIVMAPGFAILLTALSINVSSSWLQVITDPVQRWEWVRRPRSERSLDPRSGISGDV